MHCHDAQSRYVRHYLPIKHIRLKLKIKIIRTLDTSHNELQDYRNRSKLKKERLNQYLNIKEQIH